MRNETYCLAVTVNVDFIHEDTLVVLFINTVMYRGRRGARTTRHEEG